MELIVERQEAATKERLCFVPECSVLLFTWKEKRLTGRQHLEHEENQILKGINKSRGKFRIGETNLKNTEKQACGIRGGTSMSQVRPFRAGMRIAHEEGGILVYHNLFISMFSSTLASVR